MTALVAVMPIAVVWILRAKSAIRTPWVCVALAIALALGAAAAGSAYWMRRRRSGDVMFSELLLWGWLRRLDLERRLARTSRELGLDAPPEAGGEAPGPDRANEARLRQLAAALDGYTAGHSRRVARHSVMIARRMSLPDETVELIRTAATLHGVGKLRVPLEILGKRGPLTSDEYEVVKGHAEHGAAIVAGLGDPALTAIVRHHHERLDGTGYPCGLAGEEIPVGARIIAVADTYDAIIAVRPYRPAAPHMRALDVLDAEADSHFDVRVREIVAALERRYRPVTIDLPLGAHPCGLSPRADRSAASLAQVPLSLATGHPALGRRRLDPEHERSSDRGTGSVHSSATHIICSFRMPLTPRFRPTT